jgi:16S rRNA (adenine1518-N6/adenine1519-N6)-dimethyltransferase
VRARRRFGQHFLEPAWIGKIVSAVSPDADDRFLEIGPGRGAITFALAARANRLLAVEIDRDLARTLVSRIPSNVEVVTGDFLAIDIEGLLARTGPPPFRVFGNLPYNAAAPILFRLLSLAHDGALLRDATVMVQKEVADRLTAQPGSGDYGVLAALIQMRADVARLLMLPPGAFRPAPKVWSTLVRLRFGPPRVALRDPRGFEARVRGIFAYRRKTLANAIRAWANLTAAQTAGVLHEADLDGSRRPETLHLAELARLAQVFPSADRPPVL